jgi:hypothetical protein
VGTLPPSLFELWRKLCPPYEAVNLFNTKRHADMILWADWLAGENDG